MPAAPLRRDDDHERWFDLAGLAAYTGLSMKTIRRYMDDPVHPLPHHHIHVSTTDRGRILIAKREFDAWVTQFPPRAKTVKSAKVDADARAWMRKLAKG